LTASGGGYRAFAPSVFGVAGKRGQNGVTEPGKGQLEDSDQGEEKAQTVIK